MAGRMTCDKEHSEGIDFLAAPQNMRKHFKLLTVKSLCHWSEKVSEGCRKGVWQRKEDRCVFREGGHKRGVEAKSSFMLPPSLPPPSMWDISAWVTPSYLGDTMVSLSLSPPVASSLSSCMSVLWLGKPSLVGRVALCCKRAWGLKEQVMGWMKYYHH